MGGLLAEISPSASEFVCFDGNGNVKALVDTTSSSLVAQYEHGPFGEVIRATGLSSQVNPYKFSTKYQDNETGLMYYGLRYYDPSMGRWPSRDPFAELGGANLYVFAHNQALSKRDLIGLCADGCKEKDGTIVPEFTFEIVSASVVIVPSGTCSFPICKLL